MTIHIRVVTPIITQGFRTQEDATALQSEGVTVDFAKYRHWSGLNRVRL